ncbi:MAG: hypothetical protein PF689_07100 [Deltaproteobacteria bacterium]|jgi:hypothetical protein|nr:hypothetical protein [Deltaproteobacteria bacterium]
MLLLKLILFFILIFNPACDDADTGEKLIEYPLYVQGNSQAASFTSGDGWQIQLESAKMVFGNLLLCSHLPTFTKDSLTDCGEVMGEFAGAAEVDVLSDEEVNLGMVMGITGQIHSAGYNFGFIWMSSQGEPVFLNPVNKERSIYLKGNASRDASSFEFEFEIDVVPAKQGITGVGGISLKADVSSQTRSLKLVTDPSDWLAGIEFGKIANWEGEIKTIGPGNLQYNTLYYNIAGGQIIAFEFEN